MKKRQPRIRRRGLLRAFGCKHNHHTDFLHGVCYRVCLCHQIKINSLIKKRTPSDHIQQQQFQEQQLTNIVYITHGATQAPIPQTAFLYRHTWETHVTRLFTSTDPRNIHQEHRSRVCQSRVWGHNTFHPLPLVSPCC